MDRWHERGVGLLQRPGRQEFPVFDSVDPAEATVVVTRKNARRVRVVFPQLLVVCRSSCGVSFVAVLGCLGCVLGRCRGFHMSAAVTGLCCLCLLEWVALAVRCWGLSPGFGAEPVPEASDLVRLFVFWSSGSWTVLVRCRSIGRFGHLRCCQG